MLSTPNGAFVLQYSSLVVVYDTWYWYKHSAQTRLLCYNFLTVVVLLLHYDRHIMGYIACFHALDTVLFLDLTHHHDHSPRNSVKSQHNPLVMIPLSRFTTSQSSDTTTRHLTTLHYRGDGIVPVHVLQPHPSFRDTTYFQNRCSSSIRFRHSQCG